MDGGTLHTRSVRFPFRTLEKAPSTSSFWRRGRGLNQIPVGPVHAGVIEPGHFRFTTNGETVVRLEERLGYAHRESA